MPRSIFLSHNAKDKPFVRRLAFDLTRYQIPVWIDEAEIQLGDSLVEKIRTGIDGMDYLGVVLSPDSVKSPWVQREIDVAMNQEIDGRRIKVLPLLYRECDLPGFLKGKLYADFTSENRYEQSLRVLLRRLEAASDELSKADTLAEIQQALETIKTNTRYLWSKLSQLDLEKPQCRTEIKQNTLGTIASSLDTLESLGELSYSSSFTYNMTPSNEAVMTIEVESVGNRVLEMVAKMRRPSSSPITRRDE